MSLRDRILKTSKIKETAILTESITFDDSVYFSTKVPALNVALSGSTERGMSPGMLMIAGPSKHFKTKFALELAGGFYETYKDKDGVILFYDSEFGTPQEYFEDAGIPPEAVVHTPITDVEELKNDIMNQLENITQKDNVFILIDSMGNLASKKEVDDAIDGKVVTDMTRAKAFKSLFRMVTPHLSLKKLYLVVINHTYFTLEMHSKQIPSGGTGAYYSANDIWVVGRQQEKEGTEVVGYNFIVNIEKSRKVREKSKLPISVSFEKGIEKWSGMFDLALELGYIVSEKQGWYNEVNKTTGEVLKPAFRRAEKESDGDFFERLLKSGMNREIEEKFKL